MNKRKFYPESLNKFMTEEKRVKFANLEKQVNDSLQPRFSEAKKKREAIQEQLLLLEPIIDTIAAISNGGIEHMQDSFHKNLLNTCDAVFKDIAPPFEVPDQVKKRAKIAKDAKSCGIQITLSRDDNEVLERKAFVANLQSYLDSSSPKDPSTIKECRKFETIHRRIKKKLKNCHLKDFEKVASFSPWSGMQIGSYGPFKDSKDEEEETN